MIDGLIGGKLYGAASERIGSNGKPYVTAKVLTPSSQGDTIIVNVIAFSNEVSSQLLALDDGDSISLAGVLTPKAWVDQQGNAKPALDMIAHEILTAYHVSRKRQAMHGAVKTDTPADDDLGEM